METTKHYSLRFVAAILSISIALMSLPLTVFANELEHLTDHQEAESVAQKDLFEIVEKRTATTKTFRLEDGSYYIAQYDSDVHYLDESGVWQEIDNTLTAYGSEISTKNAKIKFVKKTNGSNKLFSIYNGNQKLSLSLIGANKKVTGKITNHQTEFDDKATKLEKMTTLDRVNASVLYEDILTDTDLEYIVAGVHIKENIIVKAKRESYSYSFELQLNNLIAEQTEKGEILISDPSMDQPVYLIPAPFMLDSAHQQSDRVSFELVDQGNGKYILTVNADPNWINADERVFPVTIDPPIYTNSSSAILDLDFSSSSPDSNTNTSNSLYVSNTWNNQYHESPMMFTLSGWAKGTEQIYSGNSTFAISVEIDFYDGQQYGDRQSFRLNFDKGITDWQFVSGGFVTESGHGMVKRITVKILYLGQLGEGFFDNISLVQDSPTTNLYTYTDSGYLDTYQNGRSSVYYQYNDSGDVLYEVSSNQVITAFEYDNKHRVTKARYKTYTGSFLGFSVSTKEPVVSEDITEKYYNVYEYNAYGQPTRI